MPTKFSKILLLALMSLVTLFTGCATRDIERKAPDLANVDKLLVVDCLLPGQLRKLGTISTYVAARQAIKTSAGDCEIRGGEYTAYDRSNYATSLKIWLPPAQQGDKEAQTYVGEIFEKGLGVSPDFAAAAKWYRKAAEQGYQRAQINLGFLYEKGLGVEQDPLAALNWYRKAAGMPTTIALNSDSSELQRLRQQLEKTKKQLDQSRKQMQQSNSSPGKETGKSPDVEKAKIQKLEVMVSKLQGELESRDHAAAEARKVAEIAGPSIQIVDPPILATRSPASVRIRSERSIREIVGRVVAPAGLVSLSVNDHTENPDKNGLFRVLIPVLGTATPVVLVAVDSQGKRAEFEFTLVPERATTESSSLEVSRTVGDFGTYYALVIGNDQYQRLRKLETAVLDAQSVADVLKKKYGFQVLLLLNANRYETLSALEKLRANLTERDNLLVYYSGHGELDRVNFRGNWLPVDAELDSHANWISNIAITDILNAMKAKEVLVVADSCYSGAMTRSSLFDFEGDFSDAARVKWLSAIGSARSRTFMSSGGLRPVLDSGGGNHSVFAKAFLDVLNENQDVIEGQRVYKEVAARVAYAATRLKFEQVPEYAPIRYAGHESGDFLFVPKRIR